MHRDVCDITTDRHQFASSTYFFNYMPLCANHTRTLLGVSSHQQPAISSIMYASGKFYFIINQHIMLGIFHECDLLLLTT